MKRQIDKLCQVLEEHATIKRCVDVNYAFRCMTMDVITYLCFGRSLDALNAPKFEAPIITAMDESLQVILRFKHSDVYKNIIQKCPPGIAKFLSPKTAGLIDLQQVSKWV